MKGKSSKKLVPSLYHKEGKTKHPVHSKDGHLYSNGKCVDNKVSKYHYEEEPSDEWSDYAHTADDL